MSKKISKDIMGDRQKAYEKIETEAKFRPNSILHIRLDGRGFSKFTKGLQRPYDERLSTLMIDTVKHVLERYKCLVGYTQSDEMSFILKNDYDSPCDFEGKKQKLVSSFAATATAFFNANLANRIPEKEGCYPEFDCRIFEVPNESEAANSILWREKDAIKNSVSMLAQHYFSHKELHGKSSKVKKEMLLDKGVSWDAQPQFFKSGTLVKRELYIKESSDIRGEMSTSVRSRTMVTKHILNDMEHSKRIDMVMCKNVFSSEFYAITDKPNGNDRIYVDFDKLKVDIEKGLKSEVKKVYGELEHPQPRERKYHKFSEQYVLNYSHK